MSQSSQSSPLSPAEKSSPAASSSAASMPLSTYPMEKLMLLWRREELTAEQAVGHLLRHVAALKAR